MLSIQKGLKLLLSLVYISMIFACQADGISDGASVIEGKIYEVGSEYGNLDTDITELLVKEAGLQEGERFLFGCNGKTFTVALGTTYDDVARGDWIGLINWEGKLRLARSFANAAQTSGCGLNDAVRISPAHELIKPER